MPPALVSGLAAHVKGKDADRLVTVIDVAHRFVYGTLDQTDPALRRSAAGRAQDHRPAARRRADGGLPRVSREQPAPVPPFSKADRKRVPGLFEIACRGDVNVACKFLGDLYAQGDLVRRNVKKAAELYAKACTLGYDRGCSAKAE